MDNKRVYYRGGKRTYKIDLIEKQFGLDMSTPFEFIVDGKSIEESTWVRLLERVSNYLDRRYKMPKEKLTSYNLTWSKAQIFLSEQTLHSHIKINNDLYLNTNRTSTHLCWTLIEILGLYNIDISECELYVKIPQSFEDTYILATEYENNLNIFKNYLFKKYMFDEQKIDSIIDSTKKIDKLLNDFKSKYLSILLFDDRFEYANIKSRLKNILATKIKEERHLKTINSILDIVTVFYKYKDEQEFINF